MKIIKVKNYKLIDSEGELIYINPEKISQVKREYGQRYFVSVGHEKTIKIEKEDFYKILEDLDFPEKETNNEDN